MMTDGRTCVHKKSRLWLVAGSRSNTSSHTPMWLAAYFAQLLQRYLRPNSSACKKFMFQPIWTYLSLSKHIQTYPNLSEKKSWLWLVAESCLKTSSQTCKDILNYLIFMFSKMIKQIELITLNLSEPIWVYPNISEPTWTFLNLFVLIRTYENLSKPIWFPKKFMLTQFCKVAQFSLIFMAGLVWHEFAI